MPGSSRCGKRFARARDRMTRGTAGAGYGVLDAASTYFLCVDLGIGDRAGRRSFRDSAVEKAGVAVVPVSAFAEQDPARHIVRLCFAKSDETIDAGIAAMAKAKALLA